MKLNTTLVSLGVILMVAVPAAADMISESGPGAMHHPQLPDPNGWDVDVTSVYGEGIILCDDFQPTVDGVIENVRFWVSWRGDEGGDIGGSIIQNVALSLNYDYPYGFFPVPYGPMWTAHSSAGHFTVEHTPAGEGLQGWMDPLDPTGQKHYPGDHTQYYQIDCTDFTFDPAYRTVTEGTTYWLGVSITLAADSEIDYKVGWKTSGSEQFGDNAVLWSAGTGFLPLSGPDGGPIDLAFTLMPATIVPEPVTFSLLALGGGVVLARRRRKR